MKFIFQFRGARLAIIRYVIEYGDTTTRWRRRGAREPGPFSRRKTMLDRRRLPSERPPRRHGRAASHIRLWKIEIIRTVTAGISQLHTWKTTNQRARIKRKVARGGNRRKGTVSGPLRTKRYPSRASVHTAPPHRARVRLIASGLIGGFCPITGSARPQIPPSATTFAGRLLGRFTHSIAYPVPRAGSEYSLTAPPANDTYPRLEYNAGIHFPGNYYYSRGAYTPLGIYRFVRSSNTVAGLLLYGCFGFLVGRRAGLLKSPEDEVDTPNDDKITADAELFKFGSSYNANVNEWYIGPSEPFLGTTDFDKSRTLFRVTLRVVRLNAVRRLRTSKRVFITLEAF